jgi:hypothetical protein
MGSSLAREAKLRLLRRRFSIAVWELLVLLVIIAAVATVYRVYFSRAVALTQVCERLADIQNDEVADAFDKLSGDAAQWLKKVNRLCEVRRPMKEQR